MVVEAQNVTACVFEELKIQKRLVSKSNRYFVSFVASFMFTTPDQRVQNTH